MEFQSIAAAVVTAYFATSAFILNSHLSYFSPSFMDGGYYVLPAIFVSPCIAFCHCHLLSCPLGHSPSFCSGFALAQSTALPTELQGSGYFTKNSTACPAFGVYLLFNAASLLQRGPIIVDLLLYRLDHSRVLRPHQVAETPLRLEIVRYRLLGRRLVA